MGMKIKPELLAPAGDLEKLKAAVLYGADAVYIGGLNYGLRANSKNFGADDMAYGIGFAHKHNVKVYVTVNVFARNEDLRGLPGFFSLLRDLRADAAIVSDPGVFMLAKKTVPDMDIHISTQANNTNYQSALFWGVFCDALFRIFVWYPFKKRHLLLCHEADLAAYARNREAKANGAANA